MEQLKIGSWIIEVDVNQTKAFYDSQPLITQDWDSVFEENYVWPVRHSLNKLRTSLTRLV